MSAPKFTLSMEHYAARASLLHVVHLAENGDSYESQLNAAREALRDFDVFAGKASAASDMYPALERCIPLLEQLGDFIGNGPIDPNNPASLGERCDAILQARHALGKAVDR